MYTAYCIQYDSHELEVFGHYHSLEDASNKLEQVALEFMADEEGRKRAVIYDDIPSDEEVHEGYFLCRYDPRREEAMVVPSFGQTFKIDVYLRRRYLVSGWVGTSIEVETNKIKFYSIVELKDKTGAIDTTVPEWGKRRINKRVNNEFTSNYQNVIDEFKRKLAKRNEEEEEVLEQDEERSEDDEEQSDENEERGERALASSRSMQSDEERSEEEEQSDENEEASDENEEASEDEEQSDDEERAEASEDDEERSEDEEQSDENEEVEASSTSYSSSHSEMNQNGERRTSDDEEPKIKEE